MISTGNPLSLKDDPMPRNHNVNTPVSSDDGFCGSSDISDPSFSHQSDHLMKNKPTHLSLINHGLDSTRRVRFNFQSHSNGKGYLTNQTFKQFQPIYPDEDQQNKTIHSTVV